MNTPQTIAVIAADGRSGRAFVVAALAAGYRVRAGIMGLSPFQQNESLETVHCDATNQQEVEALLAGSDAVVSLIGHVSGSPNNVQENAMNIILAAMKNLKIRRFVSLTGTGVRQPGDEIPLIDRLLNSGLQLVDPARINDGRRFVEILQASDVDWTVLRVLKLQNTKPSAFTLKEHGPTKLFVSREEVARAILEVLHEKSFYRQLPILSQI